MTLLEALVREHGQKEISGTNHNNRIVEYHSTTTLKATTDEVPWCSSLMNFCAKEAGLERTNSAAASSWTKVGRKVTEDEAIADPNGIVVLRRKGGHHVAKPIGKTAISIICYGGNQSNTVNAALYKKLDILEYRILEPEK